MKVRNISGKRLEIGATGRVVAPDEEFDVDAELGRSLCEQPAKWRAVRDKPAVTTPAKGEDKE